MKKFKYIILILIFTATLTNRYFFITEIEIANAKKGRKNVVMPPSLSLITVALGPVRGLIVDALWWKVADLQESSEYFEILRITDWITVMQPHNAFVWTYHSWNLAYNIAHEFPTPETRWKWIYSGIKLLRDEGLTMNPGNDFIENELGWMFCDRLCGFTDPDQNFFMEQWSDIMGKYLPEGSRKDIESLIAPTTEEKKKLVHEMERTLRLTPEKMLEIDKRYGPFQWRLPQSQAIYWGARKTEAGYTHGSNLNYKTTVTTSLQFAFLNGALFEDKNAGLFITTNNLEITDSIINDFTQLIQKSEHPQFEQRLFDNFISHGAPILYTFGRKELARKLFDEFKKMHPGSKVKFHTFIIANLAKMDEESAARYGQSLVEMSLFKGYVFLSKGDFEKAAQSEKEAKERWQKHQKRYASNKVHLLPPLEQLNVVAFLKLLRQFPRKQQDQLLNLVHNNMSANLHIDKKISFKPYLK